MKKLAQPMRSFFTLKISWKSSPGWLQIVFHFGTQNREEQLKKAHCRSELGKSTRSGTDMTEALLNYSQAGWLVSAKLQPFEIEIDASFEQRQQTGPTKKQVQILNIRTNVMSRSNSQTRITIYECLVTLTETAKRWTKTHCINIFYWSKSVVKAKMFVLISF